MNIQNNKKRKSSVEKIEKTFLQLIQKKNIEDISVSTIFDIFTPYFLKDNTCCFFTIIL